MGKKISLHRRHTVKRGAEGISFARNNENQKVPNSLFGDEQQKRRGTTTLQVFFSSGWGKNLHKKRLTQEGRSH